MTKIEGFKNVHQRRLDVMADCTYIKKKKGGMPYSAASHDDVISKVRTACIKHGLDFYPLEVTPTMTNAGTWSCTMTLAIVNVDDSKDFIKIPSFGMGMDKQDKAPGKAYTYAYKYALLKGFNLETGDADDPDMAAPVKSSYSGEQKNAIVGILVAKAPDELDTFDGVPDTWSEQDWKRAAFLARKIKTEGVK